MYSYIINNLERSVVFYSWCINKMENAMESISCSWIPQSPATLAFASFMAMYGRRLAVTYAPGYISDFFIKRTIVFMGSEMLGKAAGMAIVAPMFTPELIPVAVILVGGLMFYVAVLVGNLIHKIFTHLRHREKANTMS